MNSADDLLKGEMDFDTLRDEVVSLIWRDDAEGLRRLCASQIMLPFFVEKLVAEIAPGNRWNDVLCLMARRLMQADPMMAIYRDELDRKRPLVPNPAGGRELLAPFVREELGAAEFAEKVRLVGRTHTFLGLDALVADNPTRARDCVRRTVAHHGGRMDPDSRLFQMLCEMAASYHNHHHQSDLLDLLRQAGGRLNLLKSADDAGVVRIIEGGDALHDLHEEARRARAALHAGDLDAALALFERVLPKLETVYAASNPMGDWEYVNALLFTGVLLALKGEPKAAQQYFHRCMKRRFLFGLHGYGALLFFSTEGLRENAPTVRRALREVGEGVPAELAFGRFLELAGGHDFSEVNRLYDRFLVAAGDREMEEAFGLSEELLVLYRVRRSPLVPHSLCEFMLRVFRACHFALTGDVTRAEHEYVEAWHGTVPAEELRRGCQRVAAAPEKVLAHYFGD